MATVVLFHHVQGLTPGVRALAESLRDAGHTVHAPDFFDGTIYDSIDEGFAAVQERGFEALDAWADDAVESAASAGDDLVLAGISLGVMPAQRITQTSSRVKAGLFLEACVPEGEFGVWPDGKPAQIHGGDADPFFAKEGDMDAASALADREEQVELFLYPSDQHLFTDSSLPGYDQESAEKVVHRSLEFLGRL